MSNLLAAIQDATSDTSSGSWTDITGMTSGSVTVAGTGSVILLMMTVSVDSSASDDTTQHFRFDIDGSPASNGPEASSFSDLLDETNGCSLAFAVTGLSAGSHTFKVQWIDEGANSGTSSVRLRSLVVVELLAADAALQIDLSAIDAQDDPATWEDIASSGGNFTGSFTVTADSLQLMLANIPSNEAADTSSDIRFEIDTTREGAFSAFWCDATDDRASACLMYARTGLSGASHDFACQWQEKRAAAGVASDMRRTFQVVEVSDNFTLDVDVGLTSDDDSDGTFNDVLGMSGSMTPDGTDSVVLYFACGVIEADATETVNDFRLADGGTPEGAVVQSFSDTTDGVNGYCLAWANDNISGSHTFSLEWQTVSGKGNSSTDTGRERVFQVIDFAGGAPAASLLLRPRGMRHMLVR